MASAFGRPALVAPSDRSTIRAGGRLPLSSGEFSMAPIDAKIASPIAVCCWSWRLATAPRTRSRWWVGGTSTCALPANATSPSRNRRGNESTNARTARWRGLDTGGLDVGRAHRLRHVDREHHGGGLARHLDGTSRARERHDDEHQREQQARRREVASPARPGRRHRREQVDVGEAHRVLASLTLHEHVRRARGRRRRGGAGAGIRRGSSFAAPPVRRGAASV